MLCLFRDVYKFYMHQEPEPKSGTGAAIEPVWLRNTDLDTFITTFIEVQYTFSNPAGTFLVKRDIFW